MTAKANYTQEELLTAGTRFVVGGKKPTYINGKSKLAMPTLTLAQTVATMAYYEQMAMGETNAYELVPVEIDDKGGIKRLT
jgi:hypothetical protein